MPLPYGEMPTHTLLIGAEFAMAIIPLATPAYVFGSDNLHKLLSIVIVASTYIDLVVV